ncbi:hypothetical protein V6N13_064778 [Hibiscus sabdariffa]
MAHETPRFPNAMCLHQRPCGHPWLASQPSVPGESQPRDSSNGSRRMAERVTNFGTATVHAAPPPDITATHCVAIITCKK